MPGCKTCYDLWVAGKDEGEGVWKAAWVRTGLTWEEAETGEGLYCDRHRPEGALAIDIYEWMADQQEREL